MNQGQLFIASDHGGYTLKKELIKFIKKELKLKINDMGPTKYDPDDDYPDFVIPLARQVKKNKGRGVVICRNGVGVCMAVNKIKGIRCGIGYNLGAATSMMKDDNTNVISLAADYLETNEAKAILKKWLETNYSNEERHNRRLAKIAKYEKK